MTPGPPLARAAIVAVGSELLGTTRLDTNSLYLTGRLSALGIRVVFKTVIGDDREELTRALRGALAYVDVVIVTGGLGPTDDDVTRDAVADLLGVPLDEDTAIVGRIAARFAARGLRMPENNRRQALVPRGASVLENPHGTAPGLLVEHEAKLLVLLPGPPREVRTLFELLESSTLRGRARGEPVLSASLFVTGRTESHVEELAQPVYSQWRAATTPIETTILAAPGQIELHLFTRASDPDEARARLTNAQAELLAALGPDVFSTDGRPMEEILGALLDERGWTIAAAESCTGGLFVSRLTDVAGSSRWVAGGVVCYSNELKTRLVGVPPEMIAAHGAVSEPVASALADGIRQRSGADVGVGITGIAGPTGGTPAKPVGTVAIAVAAPDGTARVRTLRLHGTRTQVKFNATQAAMDMVRRLVR